MKLVFTDAAVNDLKRLREFIAQHNPDAAQRVASRLYNTIKKLVDSPQIGRPVSDHPAEIRDLIFGHYIIRYTLKKESLCILRIWHGKENRPT